MIEIGETEENLDVLYWLWLKLLFDNLDLFYFYTYPLR